MKIFKKLAAMILVCTIFIPNLVVNAEKDTETVYVSDTAAIEIQAEELYERINDFLIENKDVSAEEFDDVCKEYMKKDISPAKLLDEKEFAEKQRDGIVLYRGINQKQFSDDLRKGVIYFPSNIRNIRGMGIYTTTSLECAKCYSDKSDPGTVVKMLMPKAGIKILENEYLERLKEIIRINHAEEFGEFTRDKRPDHIFDSMRPYLDEQYREVCKRYFGWDDIDVKKLSKEEFEKILGEDLEKISKEEIRKFFDEEFKEMKKDPKYHELKAEHKRFYADKKAYIFYNSGLLTKLLGFDVLHSIDYLRDFCDVQEEEYLVINPEILSILK